MNPVQLWARLREAAGVERHCWPLWLPVALGGGCALYFAWPSEPSVAATCAAAALALTAGMGSRRWPALALVAALGLGFAAAKLREEWAAAPVLERTVIAHLTGRVEAIDPRERGVRLILGDLHSGAFGAVPGRARVSLTRDPEFAAGEGFP